LLFEEPYRFSFFQAVRLLQRLREDRAPVGRDNAPAREAVRFVAHRGLSFPASEIHELRPAKEERDLAEPGTPIMTVAFMGLTGPMGVLPTFYTEKMIEEFLRYRRIKRGSIPPLAAFLDLFNHRLISLFFRAWEKYHPFSAWEQIAREPLDRAVLSLAGLRLAATGERWGDESREPQHARVPAGAGAAIPPLEKVQDGAAGFPCERGAPIHPLLEKGGFGGVSGAPATIDRTPLLYYAGLFASRVRHASGLEDLLRGYLGERVEVIQFVGRWLSLGPGGRSRLGARGANNQLRVNLSVGSRVWDEQGKFRLRVGPLTYQRYTEFLPGRPAFLALVKLARLYTGPEYEFDVQLVLKAADVPRCRLGAAPACAALRRTTWLTSRPATDDVDNMVFRSGA
jgi:type VI secretion system protein ImpH